jgi:hypothetical protein
MLVLPASMAVADSLRFTIHKAMDADATQHVAATYLMPKGWTPKDIIRWNLAQQDSPLMVAFSVTSPDTRFAVNYINSLPHWYTRLPASSAAASGGTPPPEHPTDVIVDAFKSNHPGVDVEIVDRKEDPIASIFKPASTMETRALRCSVKFTYDLNGTPTQTLAAFDYQADDFGTLWGRAHGFSNGHWYLNSVMSVTGPVSEFSKAMRLGAVTLSSQREDPVFYEFYQRVCNALAEQMIQATNEKLKASFEQMQQYFKGMSDHNKELFDQQEHDKDIFTRNMCDFALDQERWSDGATEFLGPSGYDHALTNGTDVILVSGPSDILGSEWKSMNKVD